MAYECKKCKSKDVEARVWVKLNPLKLVATIESTIDDETWCHNCQQGGFGIKKIEQQEEGIMLGEIPDEILFSMTKQLRR